MAKKQQKTMYTPFGKGAWIKVHEADYLYKTVEGEFAVDLYLPESDAKPIIEMYDKIVVDTIAEEGGKASQDVQYILVQDIPSKDIDKLVKTDFTPDPTWYRFKFRNKEKVQPKKGSDFTNKITVLDGNNQPIDPEDKIGNGSTLRVAYIPFGWAVSGKVGCKLRLVAVQVSDHVHYSSGAVAFDKVGSEEDIPF
jgi:hypothetical protein